MAPRYEAPSRTIAGTDADLLNQLRYADGRPYGFYKNALGTWNYGDFALAIDHVQADPYAPPSSLCAWSTPEAMGLPEAALTSSDTRLAAANLIAYSFDETIRARDTRDVSVAHAGTLVLQHFYATALPNRVEIRSQVKLPARGRTILDKSAAHLFDVSVPNIVVNCLDFVSENPTTARKHFRLLGHVVVYGSHRALQGVLEERSWVSFVADEALLTRRSGVSGTPLTGDGVAAFNTPESLHATVTPPHAGKVSGMAIPPGPTLIAGGGYHDKSTLLEAIAQGVYAHILGDNHGLVATDPTATGIRAADGRAVAGVGISLFITHLPGGADTTSLSAENVSGSASQVASTIESLELNAHTLLIDENTSATSLLTRDTRMYDLVVTEKGPITPLVDCVASLIEAGVSLVMVVGGSDTFLDAADRVLMMGNYRCLDVAARACEIVTSLPRLRTDAPTIWEAAPRVPATKARVNHPHTRASGTSVLTIDRSTIDISDIAVAADPGRAETIAWCVRGVFGETAGKQLMPNLVAKLGRHLASGGLDAVCKLGARSYPAFLARPRLIDVGVVINRYRGLSLREPRGRP